MKTDDSYEIRILTKLVEKYRSSKKDTGGSAVNRKTAVIPADFYKEYASNDADYDEIQRLNEVVYELSQKRWVTYTKERFGNQILKIFLTDEQILEIETYLSSKYGYVTKDEKLAELQKLVDTYENSSECCRMECSLIKKWIDERKPPKSVDLPKKEKVLKALAFIENNTSRLYLREVSQIVFGTTKILDSENKEEGYILEEVCRILNKKHGKDLQDGEYPDDILKGYQIFREPEQITVKGPIKIYIGDTVVDVSAFQGGITFSANTPLTKVVVTEKRLVTVENKTAYYRFSEPDTAVMYLGGFSNRFQERFLDIVYLYNPGLEYFHFGDIDVNGFWIHHNLKENTKIPFQIYRMGIDELADERYKDCLIRLTENDKKRIVSLLDYPEYREVVQYMIDHGVKLEQEIIALTK